MSDDWTHEPDPAVDWELDEEPWDDDEYDEAYWEDHRPATGGGRKVLAVLAVLVALVAAGGWWAWSQVQDRIDPPGPPGAAVEVEIPSGATTEAIGGILADHDVISSSRIWGWWTRFEGVGPFQAGLYELQQSSSFQEAVAVLDAGPRPPERERVTIPEGLTVSQILERLADDERGVPRWSLEALQTAASSEEVRSRYQPEGPSDCLDHGGPPWCALEGLLFPDTYEIAEEVDEAAFLRRLVSEMDARLDALDVEGRAAELGRTPYEVVVVASLIEAETRVDEERGKVARVIYNRLAEGTPLGIDATSRYESDIAGRGRDSLDFTTDSPYNTRRVAGVPPTPIAAPGQASLEAALDPTEGPWIYYVLQDEDGNHFFTDSYSEFNRAKAECARLGLGCG